MSRYDGRTRHPRLGVGGGGGDGGGGSNGGDDVMSVMFDDYPVALDIHESLTNTNSL